MMSARTISAGTYVAVLVALVILTVLTVAISFAPLAGRWHIVLGLSIAAVKAALVLLFFMHALHASRATRAVIAASLTGLAILLILTYTDYLSRGLIPNMPGH